MSSPARSSAATNGEEPSITKMKNKKRKTTPQQQSTSIPSFPDDLLICFFARISRLYYPSLSLVSKRFRSLLTSPELYKARSLLGHTEKCLYVCLQFSPDPNPRWFTLCRKPTNDTTKKKKNSNGYVLATIPTPNSPKAHWNGVVSVGSSIYTIGGPINDSPSSNVWALDCHCHTWSIAPSMSVERDYPAANVIDGKIYVAGGNKESNSSNWMEVFDPKTRIWEPVVSPQGDSRVDKSTEIKGRIYYLFRNGGLVYKPREDKWERIGETTTFDLGWSWLSYCVVDNVLYCHCNIDGLKWYDTKSHWWMNLKGLKGLPKFASYGCVKLADYGGKLAVFWTKYFRASGYKKTRIWCAVIVLERRDNGEIWGNVESLDPVLTVPNSFHFVRALAVTV